MAGARRRRRTRLDRPEALDEVLDRAGEDRFAKKRPPIPVAEWRAAVGPRIADRARPVAIERGILIVRVATSVWANELQMLSSQLVERLKTRGFAVEGIRFRVGVLDPVDRPPERRTFRKVPPPAPLEPELRAAVDRVEDADLRAAIEEAARANLAWQTMVKPPATEAPRDARGPRGAGRGTAPQGRSEEDSGGASRRNRGGDGDRRR